MISNIFGASGERRVGGGGTGANITVSFNSFSPYFRLAFRLASASVSDSDLTGD